MQSPTELARKWAKNLGSAGESIKAGVNAVTESPTAKAARQVDAYQQGVLRSVADGKYQAGLRRVTLEDWRKAMLEKGAPRVAAGASAAIPKMENFLGEFLPHLEQGQRLLESMPRGDISQNIARAVAMIEHNSKFRRRG